MEYVQRLPFILGASMALIIGLISSKNGEDIKTTYIKMSVVLVIFFILGLYIRKFIYKLYEEIRKKEEEERKIEEQKLKNEIEGVKHNVDYRVDDNTSESNIKLEKGEKLYDEEFTPLKVNSVKINKDEKN